MVGIDTGLRFNAEMCEVEIDADRFHLISDNLIDAAELWRLEGFNPHLYPSYSKSSQTINDYMNYVSELHCLRHTQKDKKRKKRSVPVTPILCLL